jgi:uncharacterized membrane protein YuzA (DUF378 family)
MAWRNGILVKTGIYRISGRIIYVKHIISRPIIVYSHIGFTGILVIGDLSRVLTSKSEENAGRPEFCA